MIADVIALLSGGVKKIAHVRDSGSVISRFMHGLQTGPHLVRAFTPAGVDHFGLFDVVNDQESSIGVIESPDARSFGVVNGIGAYGPPLHICLDTTQFEHKRHPLAPNNPIPVV